jgi:hypothetical protein
MEVADDGLEHHLRRFLPGGQQYFRNAGESLEGKVATAFVQNPAKVEQCLCC